MAGLEITVRPRVLCDCLPREQRLPLDDSAATIKLHLHGLMTGLTFSTRTSSTCLPPERFVTFSLTGLDRSSLSTGRCIRIFHGSHDGQSLQHCCQVESAVVLRAMYVHLCLLPRKASTARTHRCSAGRNIGPLLVPETSIHWCQVDARHAQVESEGLSCSLQVRALNECLQPA